MIKQVFCLLFILNINKVSAQEEVDFEEISVFLYTRQIGGTDMPAYIHGQLLYLPVTNVFTFLTILNTPTPGFDTVSGFFINQQSPYLIDRVNNRINFHGHVYQLMDGDLIRTENNLYLKINYFGEIFGLECSFSFSSMSVTLTTKLELPVVREMRQRMMRTNLNRLKGDIRPDTVIKRNYPLFHFGAADWTIAATERFFGQTDARVGLTLGALVAGGEATVGLSYSTNQPFDQRQQFYSWHFANNDLKPVKQITIGKIPTPTSISLPGSVIGMQVTNTPTTFQRSFCSYTLSDYTQPGWIVELYVNHVLIDYVKADANGYYAFEVPLVYGNTMVKLRFYGPWGEEHTLEQAISIPFNFLPPRKFEYTFNAGMVENELNGKYSKLNLNYGATRRLTLGSGVEYLSSLSYRPVMPFATFSLRLASNILLSGEYIFGVKFRGVFSYRLPSNLLFEFYYTNLNIKQQAIHANYLQERKAVISIPIRTRVFTSLMRLTVNQYIVPGSKYFTSELLLSGNFLGVSTNLTTTALFFETQNAYVASILSLGIKMPAKIILTPQLQYDFSQTRLMSGKIQVEKRFFRNGTFNVFYEKNFVNNLSTVQVGVRYDFSAVQASLTMRNAANQNSLVQFARGSMVYEGKQGNLQFSRNSSVGKGGIVVLPFLDINANGKYDEGEQRVFGLNLKVSGGRIEKVFKDSTIRISELEPFATYYIELDRLGFENISWQIPQPVISITINPNQYRTIEVPIRIMGEVSGMVYLDSDTIRKGIGNVYVLLYHRDQGLVAKIITENDGYFTFFGLAPGEYTATLDSTQLNNIKMIASPSSVPFEIEISKEGGQTGGIEFILHKESPLRNKKE